MTQQVTVHNGLAYVWNGTTPLEIGDCAQAPGNWVTNYEPFYVIVTALTSDYQGHCVPLSHRIHPDDIPERLMNLRERVLTAEQGQSA